MLVATPGQAATYSLLGSSAPKKTCLLNSSATPKSTINNSTASTNNNNNCSTTAATLMKTIQVRLNRGTEFLKDTVQKALTTNSTNTSTSTSSISFLNNNKTNNINSTVVGPLKHIHASSAVTTSVPSKTSLVGKSTYTTALAAAASTSGVAIVRTSIATNTSKTVKLNTVQPTKIHRYPQERQETSSTDSINKEMCHFKPILPAPTMRWKCGSKSRGGATIKMPVACLATNIKNLNCGDCSKFIEDSSEGEQDVEEDEAMEVAGTKHPYKNHLYKPKPSSTLLSTIITSPSHQSAFVRLVAQMKTLVNIHPTPCEKPHNSASKKKEHTKTRNTARRGRSSNAALALKMQQLRKSPMSLPFKLNLTTELIIKKGRTANTKANSVTTSKSTNAAKDKKRTAALSVKVDNKRGKRNTSKSNVINIVAFAKDKNATENAKRKLQMSKSKVVTNVDVNPAAESKHQQRKRKHVNEVCLPNDVVGSDVNELRKTSSTEASVMPPLRKSARLSKDGNNEFLTIDSVKRITLRKRNTRYAQQRAADTFSPPMTRSRLKELMQKQCSSFVMDGTTQLIV